MHGLMGLPKKAHIISDQWFDLHVNDNLVSSHTYLMRWIIGVVKHGDWEVVLPQLISQGFKFEAVKEECILNLQDTKKCVGIFWSLYKSHYNWSEITQFTSGSEAREISHLLIKKIETCKNWNQLKKMIRHGNIFNRFLANKIMDETKLCRK